MRCPLVSLSLALGVTLAAAQLPDARQLLARSDDPLFTARTARLQFDSTSDATVSGAETKVPAFILLEIGGGNRFRYSAHMSDSDLLVVSNGSNVWRSSSKEKTWTVAPFAPASLQQYVENIVYGRGLANIREAKVDRRESITISGRAIECYVVRAEYLHMPGFSDSGIATRAVWLDVDRNLIWRDRWEGQILLPQASGPANRRTDYLYSLLEFDKDLSADLFTFQPPEGSVQATPPAMLKTFTPPRIQAYGDPLAAMTKGSGNGKDPGQGNTAAGDVFRVGGDVSPPSVIYKVDPEYSDEARNARHSGTVVLSIIVDTEGKARAIHVIKTLGMGLDEKAVEAVQKWKFHPAMKGLTPVNVRATVEVNFRLWGPAWVVERVKFQPPSGTHPASLRSPRGTPWARSCTQMGTVTIGLTVAADGRPTNPKILQSSNASINESALAAVTTFFFNPAMQGVNAVPSDGEVELSCTDRFLPTGEPEPPPQ